MAMAAFLRLRRGLPSPNLGATDALKALYVRTVFPTGKGWGNLPVNQPEPEMRILLTATLALFLAGAADASAAECSLKTITACENTNDLQWSKAFDPALKRFTGTKKYGWLGKKMPLDILVSEVMSGSGADKSEVSPGIFRFTGFRIHSATERGAVFVAADGTIKAVGVLHFNCTKRCENEYHLSIILPKKDEVAEKLVRAWGDDETRQNAEKGYQPGETVVGVTDVIIRKP